MKPENYSPISLTNTMCKVLEKIIKKSSSKLNSAWSFESVLVPFPTGVIINRQFGLEKIKSVFSQKKTQWASFLT